MSATSIIFGGPCQICWHGKNFSMAGRIELVKSVLQSVLMNNFKVYLWPGSLLKEIQACARNFIFSGSSRRQKLALFSWDRICYPKTEGGLGLRRFDILNSSCLLKTLRNSCTGTSLCANYLQARYSLDSSRRNFSCSSLWSGFRSVMDFCINGSAWIVGDGNDINLWHDCWLDSVILPRAGGMNFCTKLSVAIQNRDWNFPNSFFEVFPHLKESITSSTFPLFRQPDRLVWRSTRDASIYLRDCYHFICPSLASQP